MHAKVRSVNKLIQAMLLGILMATLQDVAHLPMYDISVAKKEIVPLATFQEHGYHRSYCLWYIMAREGTHTLAYLSI